jgi:hypothetical protein
VCGCRGVCAGEGGCCFEEGGVYVRVGLEWNILYTVVPRIQISVK